MLKNFNWVLLIGVLAAAGFGVVPELLKSYSYHDSISHFYALNALSYALLIFSPFLAIWQAIGISKRGGRFIDYFKLPVFTSFCISFLILGLLYVAAMIYAPGGDRSWGATIALLLFPPAGFVLGLIISLIGGVSSYLNNRYQVSNLLK